MTVGEHYDDEDIPAHNATLSIEEGIIKVQLESESEPITAVVRNDDGGGTSSAVWKRSSFAASLVFCIGVAAVALMSYMFTASQERSNSEDQFHHVADDITQRLHMSAENLFLSTASFSDMATSYALSANQTWPYVTIPDFEMRGSYANRIAKTCQIALYPRVAGEDQKTRWEGYSINNQEWILEGLEYMTDNSALETMVRRTSQPSSEGATVPPVGVIRPTIFRFNDENMFRPNNRVTETGRGPFLPVWQVSPSVMGDDLIINYNVLSHPVFSRVYEEMQLQRRPVMSEMVPINFLMGRPCRPRSRVNNMKGDARGGNNRGSSSETVHSFPTPELSFLMQPLYENFENESPIVGAVSAMLNWTAYFENLVPVGTNGIVVVVTNTCGDSFTYQLNGPDPIFLGVGDVHDPIYDHREVSALFSPFIEYDEDGTGICQYQFSIFPSTEFESVYSTSNPIIYAVVAAVGICLYALCLRIIR